MLQHLLKPSRYKDSLQWDSTRSYSAAYGNIWSYAVLGSGSVTIASADINMLVTTTPTRGTWFERFLRGNKKLSVIINRNNFGLSVEALHIVIEDME